MKAISALLLLSVLCLTTGNVRGADAPAWTPWVPSQGLWWNPAEHGIYYHVSVGPGGFMFVALTLYDRDGKPDFLVMQGRYEPDTAEQWLAGRLLPIGGREVGRLRSPLYRMTGGRCLDCDYRNSTTTRSEFGDAELVFFANETAEFRRGSSTMRIEPYPLYNRPQEGPAQRYAGLWQVTMAGGSTETVLLTARPPATVPGFGPAYEIQCLTCAASGNRSISGELHLWPGAGLQIESFFIGRGIHWYPTHILHERDGVLYGRSAPVGTELESFVMRR